jgi:mRNA interferase RelE/StbE
MFDVQFTRRAAKQLAKLPRDDQVRVLKKLEGAAKDPARLFMPLKGVEGFRMRAGDLRVLAAIDAQERTIIVATIGPRENIYK